MQLSLAHFIHSWHPELVVKKQLNPLLFVRDSAESFRRKLFVASGVKELGDRSKGHRRALDLDDLLYFRP